MKRIVGIRLKNFVLYPKVSLRLDVPGITMVYGRNKNAGERSTNAAGKSLLLSALPQLRYDSSPLTTEIKTRAKKDAWGADTRVEVVVAEGDHEFTLIKEHTKRSFAYEVLRDGKPAKVRTSEYAKSLFERILPWSETEYFTYIHLDSSRPNLLRTGSPAQRLEFFSEVFGLDNLDDQRKLIKAKLNAVHDKEVVRKEIEATRAEYKAKIRELEDGIPADADDISRRIGDLNKKIKALQQVYTELKSVAAVAEVYDYVSRVCGRSRDEIATWLEDVDGRIRKGKKLLAVAQQWQSYDESLAAYVAQRKAFTKAQERLLRESWCDGCDDPTQYRAIYSKKSKQHKELRATRAQLQSDLQDYDLKQEDAHPKLSASELEDKIQVGVAREKKLTSSLAHVRKLATSFAKHFDGSADAACPVCATELPATDQKELYEIIQRDMGSLETKLAAVTEKLAEYRRSLSHRQGTKVAEKLARIEATWEEEERREQATLELLSVQVPVKPSEPDAPRPDGVALEKIETQLAKLQRLKVQAQVVLPMADTCSQYIGDDVDLQAWLTKTETKLAYLQEKVKPLADAWTATEANRIFLGQMKESLAQLDAKLADHAVDDDEAKLWGILYEALSNKKLKTILVQRLAKHLEISMNRNASLLFREPTRFAFHVEGVNFHILATRRVDGVVRTADVRTLSGAESRAFSFLLALSIIPLLPDDRRTNLMVLDEPTTNMDEPFIEMFCGQFLPKLASVIPSVVVISPLPLDISVARTVLVTKEGKSTTVSITKPAQLRG